MTLFYVACGSALGGLARFLVGSCFGGADDVPHPMATLIVNASGSFVLGLIAAFGVTEGEAGADARAFLVVGLCGGFTTFSTFSLETFLSLRDGGAAKSLLLAVTSVVLCIAATWAGFALAALCTSKRR